MRRLAGASPLLGVAVVVAVAFVPALADDRTDAAFAVKPATTLGDGALRDLRGKYVPAGVAVGTLAGSVVYFGVQLETAWTTHANGVATTYDAAENVTIDLSGRRPVVTVRSASGVTGPGGASGGSGSAATAPSAGLTSGVSQTIGVAGNGNSVQNGASVTVSSVRPVFVIAPASGAPCGAPCELSTGPDGLTLGIALPGGAATQSIGPGGIAQSVSITSNTNAVTNSMALGVQLGRSPAGPPALTLPSLFGPLPTGTLR